MKPEGQEYHEKREEAYVTQKRVNVWIKPYIDSEIYTVKVRRFRLKLFLRLNGFKDECV